MTDSFTPEQYGDADPPDWEPEPPSYSWDGSGAGPGAGTDYWSNEAVATRRQDQIDAWPGLEQEALRHGLSPRELQRLGQERGWVENDRSGRPRVSPGAAMLLRDELSGRSEFYDYDVQEQP